MVSVLQGPKGSGKTQRITALANAAKAERKGAVCFIADNASSFDIERDIRFINLCDYGIRDPRELIGFLKGIASANFDTEAIFLDGLCRLMRLEGPALEGLLKELSDYSAACRIDLTLTVSCNVPAAYKASVV